jgi:hypothetical protein
MNNKVSNAPIADPIKEAIRLLDLHYEAFFGIADIAKRTGHPVPMDTRGWSQMLVSLMVGIRGVDRKKGADLADGSDVKAANTWNAIDTPRFNGVLKAGTKSLTAGDVASLDSMPHLYFVLWDHSRVTGDARCRVWTVRTQYDPAFKKMAGLWYDKVRDGTIISTNFQLHPPRGLDTDTFRNTCGHLSYPKLFEAVRPEKAASYVLKMYDPDVLEHGVCEPV